MMTKTLTYDSLFDELRESSRGTTIPISLKDVGKCRLYVVTDDSIEPVPVRQAFLSAPGVILLSTRKKSGYVSPNCPGERR